MKPSIAKCLVYWWSQHSSCTAFPHYIHSKGFQFSKLVCCLRSLKNVMASKPVFQLQWGKHDAWPVVHEEGGLQFLSLSCFIEPPCFINHSNSLLVASETLNGVNVSGHVASILEY